MIEYTAIKHDDNLLVITMNNKCKDLLHNIDFDFKIIRELWYIEDEDFGTVTYDYEPPFGYEQFDYEVTLQFKSEEDREFFDYILDRHCSNIDKLEYALEVAA